MEYSQRRENSGEVVSISNYTYKGSWFDHLSVEKTQDLNFQLFLDTICEYDLEKQL